MGSDSEYAAGARVLLLVISLCAALTADPSGFSLLVDPTGIPDTLLAPVVDAQSRDNALFRFEREYLKSGPLKVNILRHSPVLFTYRDSEVLPLYRRIIKDKSIPLYFRLRAVYALGEIGCGNDFSFLLRYTRHENALLREYVACALGKTGSKADADTVESIAKRESNLYVRSTLDASVKRIRELTPYIFSQLPVYDSSGSVRKLAFFPSAEFSAPDVVVGKKDSQSSEVMLSPAKMCFAPHQQYKANDRLYELIEYPSVSFGLQGDWGFHVGEDSGWLFDGMPVHTVLDGVVVALQYETTWGCLVITEALDPNGNPLTVYYGHLSRNVDVGLGEHIRAGQKIGEIAPSFSFENGGYLSHLHLGIEKAAYSEALVKGWYESLGRWHSPVEFIREFAR